MKDAKNVYYILLGSLLGVLISVLFYPEHVKNEKVAKVNTQATEPVLIEGVFANDIPEEYEIIAIPEEETKTELKSLGIFKLTAYCPCEKCCGKSDGITATGKIATSGHTVAVDPQLIPYGTTLLINGNEYVAEDCGGAIKGNRIDIFFDTHSEAINFGIAEAEIFMVMD